MHGGEKLASLDGCTSSVGIEVGRCMVFRINLLQPLRKKDTSSYVIIQRLEREKIFILESTLQSKELQSLTQTDATQADIFSLAFHLSAMSLEGSTWRSTMWRLGVYSLSDHIPEAE